MGDEVKIVDMYATEQSFDFLYYRKAHYSDMDDFVGFNYEIFRSAWWTDGGIGGDAFDKERKRYHESVAMSLPVPFKGNPSQLAFLKPKVESCIDYYKKNAKHNFPNNEPSLDPDRNATQKVIDLVRSRFDDIKTDYARRLTNNLKEWNNYLRVKKDIAERKAKNADKLPGSEYWNSIYAGGSNFCPLNSFVPGSPPAGFIYAGDKRFHQFILKQGE